MGGVLEEITARMTMIEHRGANKNSHSCTELKHNVIKMKTVKFQRSPKPTADKKLKFQVARLKCGNEAVHIILERKLKRQANTG